VSRGERHHDGIDEADPERAVLPGETFGGVEVILLAPCDRERTVRQIREERVLCTRADVIGEKVVDFRQDGPRQQPFVGRRWIAVNAA
jgi:hypothetical protein